MDIFRRKIWKKKKKNPPTQEPNTHLTQNICMPFPIYALYGMATEAFHDFDTTSQ